MAGDLHPLVDDPSLEAPAGMYDVAEPLDGFDISHKGIVFCARNLAKQRDPAMSLATDAYFVPLDSFTLPPHHKPRLIKMPAEFGHGPKTNIRFSPDASDVAFMATQTSDIYNPRLYMTSVSSLEAFDVLKLVTGVEPKDHDPLAAFEFAGASDRLILKSQKTGRVALSTLKLEDGQTPKFIMTTGSTDAFHPLRRGEWDTLLISGTSYIDSSLWQILDVEGACVTKTVSSLTKDGAKFGLSPDMVTEM